MSVREATLHPVQAYANSSVSRFSSWRGRAIAAAKGGLAGLKKATAFVGTHGLASGLLSWTVGGSPLRASDPGLQQRLTRFLVVQLIDSPIAPTTENTPPFVHSELEQISRLRDAPRENRDREIGLIAGRLLTNPRAARDLYTILNHS